MPGYKTHLTAGAVVGVGLGTAARFFYGVSIPQSIFGGVLCALGGVLPDVDSSSSRAFKRCFSTISGTFSLLLASRLNDFRLTPETIVMIGATAYFVIYYFVGSIVKKAAVHRGMCHSLVFGLIAGEIVFILSSGDVQLRLFKSAAIALGVLVHLTLDEINSVETSGSGSKRVYLKKSFGTALKLIDYKHMRSTIAFYIAAALLGNVAMNVNDALARFEKKDVEKIRGKAAVDRVRLIYPTQFDLTAVQWVAENDLVLSPGTDDNAKWAQLQEMLAIGDDANDAGSAQANPDEKAVSLLDVVNWDSRNADKEEK